MKYNIKNYKWNQLLYSSYQNTQKKQNLDIVIYVFVNILNNTI